MHENLPIEIMPKPETKQKSVKIEDHDPKHPDNLLDNQKPLTTEEAEELIKMIQGLDTKGSK